MLLTLHLGCWCVKCAVDWNGLKALSSLTVCTVLHHIMCRAGTAPVGGRYASPGPSATAQQAGSAAAARRGSNASAASLYSAESLESAGRPGSATRRVVGSSPLRGTAGAPVATSAGTTKRYSTPTPQSNQHYDFDSMASGGSAGSAQPRRSATPTKATWKF